MARMRERVFAGLGAILFFFCAIAATILTVHSASNSSNTNAAVQTASTCDINTPVPSDTMTPPDVYKPDGAVTELKTTDIEQGTGQTAKNGDCLVMKYQGNLAADGTVFDENYDKPQALQFPLGSSDPQQQVIAGWEQGLVGMKVGGTRRVLIPSSLGYGENGSGSTIPPNADLVFIVKLLQIK